MITVGCPQDISVFTDPGKSHTLVYWVSAKAREFSSNLHSLTTMTSNGVLITLFTSLQQGNSYTWSHYSNRVAVKYTATSLLSSKAQF